MKFERFSETQIIQPEQLNQFVAEGWDLIHVIEDVYPQSHYENTRTTDNYGNVLNETTKETCIESRTTRLLIGLTIAQKVLFDKAKKDKEDEANS